MVVRCMTGLTHVESPPLPVSLDRSKTKRKEATAAMKDQAIHYLGLDVHQATVVATSRNESGAIVLKATVPTEAKAIVSLVRGQGPRVQRTTARRGLSPLVIEDT